MAKQTKKVEKSLEELLWDSANKLRGTVVSYDYMNVCLGLIFLKYAGDRFDARRTELIEMGREKYIDMPAFYMSENVFYLTPASRWSYLIENAKTKIQNKGCDYLVANDISRNDIGFSSDLNEVYIFDKNLNICHLEKDTKINIARKILEKIFE